MSFANRGSYLVLYVLVKSKSGFASVAQSLCGRVRVWICLRSSGARLMPEPWCTLVPEHWCPLVPVVKSVSGFASVAQMPAWFQAPMPAGARALVPIGACGRVRVRICLRGSAARLVPEPWCSLVPEPWCALVPLVEAVSGFASVAQVPAWCPSPVAARWCPSLGAHCCLWSSPCQDLPLWLKCPPGARALLPAGARALVLIGACGRVRVRICLRGSGAAWCPSPGPRWCPSLDAHWCLWSSPCQDLSPWLRSRLVPELWCPLMVEPWCPLVPVVDSVSGFASVAQLPAWCPSLGARWCPSLDAHWCPWSSPCQDLPPWLRCPPGARALVPAGGRAKSMFRFDGGIIYLAWFVLLGLLGWLGWLDWRRWLC